MVPSGEPEVTLDQLDLDPLRITCCLRPVRKCLSQACKQPSIPLLFNFSRSRCEEEHCRMLGQVKENHVSWARQIT